MFATNFAISRRPPIIEVLATPAQLEQIMSGLQDLTAAEAARPITWQLRGIIIETAT